MMIRRRRQRRQWLASDIYRSRENRPEELRWEIPAKIRQYIRLSASESRSRKKPRSQAFLAMPIQSEPPGWQWPPDTGTLSPTTRHFETPTSLNRSIHSSMLSRRMLSKRCCSQCSIIRHHRNQTLVGG